MAVSAFSGPIVIFGQGPSPDNNPALGSSLFYAGIGTIDPRLQFSYQPGEDITSGVYGWLGDPLGLLTMYVVPQTLTTNLIATAQHITSSTAMVLTATNATGVAAPITIPRQDTGVNVTGLIEIDPLVISCTASTVAGSTTLNVTAMVTATCFHRTGICPGMVLTDVTSAAAIPTGTTITGFGSGGGGIGTYTMSAAAVTTRTGDNITGLYTQFPHAIPIGSAGQIRLWNPNAMCSRAIAVTCSATTGAGGIFTVNGLDVYGFPMTESLTMAASTTLISGLKAWKYIKAVTPNFTDASLSYSIGTLDLIGLPIRSDNFQVGMTDPLDVAFMWENAAITSTTGYVAAVKTVATATTGDVRGTYALQTASNGTVLFAANQGPLPANVQNAVGMYGVTQFASW